MPVLVSNACPRCGAHRVACNGVGEPGVNYLRQIAFGLFQCARCQDGVVIELPLSDETSLSFRGHPAARATVVKVVPERQEKLAPDGTPLNSKLSYERGLRALDRQDDAAGMMFRKALDAAVKSLQPSGKGNLKQRIDDLPAEMGVTPAMKEWAHAIREEANEAAAYSKHRLTLCKLSPRHS